jgi:hypothetical protein
VRVQSAVAASRTPHVDGSIPLQTPASHGTEEKHVTVGGEHASPRLALEMA